ncbi:metal ABC transporter ATP-binding protein [Microbacterium sp.]|uniref:metal ABC transporter ATP-binding protein n=1 Tax=Microbacterium sp. TaxID=51671 RepID=UPI002D78352B|nr:metal ABC transporter ATP-binding protein [Microbacterium sp.]HET6302846.1 metal ABC transporter ATP-binding protein [Microbacterium sp.]
MSVIDVRDLEVSYRGVRAVDGATLSIGAGTVCGLVGKAGSGKTSLFKAIVGAVRPDRGTIRLDDRAPHEARRAGLVAYVPQSEQIDGSFPVSVRDVVMMGRYGSLGFTRRPRAADQAAVDGALARVELDDLADRPLGKLSHEQRTLAFVARALAQEARIFLLDEPFAGVDKGTEVALTRLLRELATQGCTVFVSTRDVHVVPELCDDVILFLRNTLLHASPDVALRPEHVSRALGLNLTRPDEQVA